MESPKKSEAEFSALWKHRKDLCAVAVAVTVFMCRVVERTLLAVHMFPSARPLAVAQHAAAALVLSAARRGRPPLDGRLARRLLPLWLVCCARVATCTSPPDLPLPVVAVCRHLGVALTLLLRRRVLEPSAAAMAAGALVCTLSAPCSPTGYALVVLDNALLAARAVCLERILKSEAIGVWGLLYYEATFRAAAGAAATAVAAVAAAGEAGVWREAAGFLRSGDGFFLCHLHMFCALSFVRASCEMACVKHAGAASAAVVRTLTDVAVTHAEWLITGSYVFRWLQAAGSCASVCAGVLCARRVLGRPPRARDAGAGATTLRVHV